VHAGGVVWGLLAWVLSAAVVVLVVLPPGPPWLSWQSG
jgi:hypothetical protein